MSACFKIEFRVDGRSLGTVSFTRCAPLTTETLTTLLLSLDEKLRGRDLSFAWMDENDDEVLIESDADLNEAIHTQTHTQRDENESIPLRFIVTAKRENSAPSRSAATSKKFMPQQDKQNKPPAVPVSAEEKNKPLSELSTEEVVCVFEKLHIPFVCHALVREIPIGGGVLACVESIEDLRDCGLAQDKLSNVHAKMLLKNVLEMQKKGVPARFLMGNGRTTSLHTDAVPVAVAVLVDEVF